MKQYLLFGTVLSFLLVPLVAESQEAPAGLVDEGPDRHLIYRPADVEWQPGPGSFEPGAEFAVLEGSPGEPGVFNMRIRMPEGFVIAPHWHPNVERVTVISGAFHLGHGEVLDREAAVRLGPGSYFSLPPETPHYAIMEGETIIQLTSVGPWQINYVNPADDPRTRE
jgi:quercetin dioxygenase-like cupin family protein